jgi:hypothetical protein
MYIASHGGESIRPGDRGRRPASITAEVVREDFVIAIARRFERAFRTEGPWHAC